MSDRVEWKPLTSPKTPIHCAVSLRRWLELPSAPSLEASTSLDPEVLSVLTVGADLLRSTTSARGLRVLGSMPFCRSYFLRLEFQRFLISLSVLPGSLVAIWDHLFIDVKKKDIVKECNWCKILSVIWA
jgi:hypothetical protein